ncbi:MAG: FAD-dependent oxidoreductase [Mesorhizobium sp.]|nr:MAG: FAD-dependent oxidoreductase [Mesorhizobium sp.]
MTESNRSIPARTATNFDVLVIGAGPAGAMAALRAADLGARTALVTRPNSGAWPHTTAPSRCVHSHAPLG